MIFDEHGKCQCYRNFMIFNKIRGPTIIICMCCEETNINRIDENRKLYKTISTKVSWEHNMNLIHKEPVQKYPILKEKMDNKYLSISLLFKDVVCCGFASYALLFANYHVLHVFKHSNVQKELKSKYNTRLVYYCVYGFCRQTMVWCFGYIPFHSSHIVASRALKHFKYTIANIWLVGVCVCVWPLPC